MYFKSIILLLIFTLVACANKSEVKEQASSLDAFERISPENAGYSSEALSELAQYLKQSGSSSMLLLHDGKVFFEWGDISRKHLIHSVRKPLMNALMGTLYDQGLLDLDITLKELAVQDSPSPLTETELSATVGMILKSRSGIYHDSTAESAWMKSRKPARGSFNPGEHYYYNNWDFNFAGFLYEKISQQSIYDAFDRLIAKPLGMKHYQNQQATIQLPSDELLPNVDAIYQYETTASQYPAYHFRMSAHDLALFAQLYANRGKWKGEQILSEEWIDLSTKPYSIENEKYGLGYGLLWKAIVKAPDDPHPNSFYHTGVGVHMIGVYPKHKLVMVHRVDTEKTPVKFKADNLYSVIRMMHGARIN